MCTLYLARARAVALPAADAPLPAGNAQPNAAGAGGALPPGSASVPAIAIELVGDRFLRRMVRVLVGTALREAVPGAAVAAGGGGEGGGEGALAALAERGERRLTALPAPALGLCFAAVGGRAYAA